MYELLGGIIEGIILGVPLIALLAWPVGLLFARGKTSIERARLGAIWTWLIISFPSAIKGNWVAVLALLPAALIVWWIRRQIALRKKIRATVN